MIQSALRRQMGPMLTMALMVAGVLATGAGIAHGHGGKTHAGEPFSAFEAVQKAVELYDRLIVAGKLAEEWETDLTSIHVSVRSVGNRSEYVVQFKRSGGDPQQVYFFFDRLGDYSGSNFTGK